MITSSLARMANTINVFGLSSESSLDSGDTDNVRGKAFQCIEKHQWESLRNLLKRVESDSANASEIDLATVDKDGRNILHTISSNEPPHDVVKTVATMFPAMLDATDRFDRAPLHEAIRHCASFEVVKLLVKSAPECTMIKDVDGKNPLILACEQIGQFNVTQSFPSFEGYEAERKLQHMCKLAQDLALYSPPSVLVEDKDGMTALEHALDSEAPYQTIRTLQHVTSRLTKKLDTASDETEMVSQQSSLEKKDTDRGLLGSNMRMNSVVAAGA